MIWFNIIGSTLLSLCAVPQAYKSYKTKSADDISLGFLLLWLLGEISAAIYMIFVIKDAIILANYIVNIICISIILKYKRK